MNVPSPETQPDCVDLKAQFGSKYRVAIEESYHADSGSDINRNTDPWNWILRGSRGHVCPWGGDLLAVCLNTGHPNLAARLLREPWVMVNKSQSGDNGEVNAVFHVDHLEAAAKHVKLYRRQQLSDEERQRRSDHMRAVLDSQGKTPFSDQGRDPIVSVT